MGLGYLFGDLMYVGGMWGISDGGGMTKCGVGCMLA